MHPQFQLLYLRRVPFLKILIPLLLGIILSKHFPYSLSVFLTIVFLFLGGILFFAKTFQQSYTTNHFFGLFISLFLLFFGSSYTHFRTEINFPNYFQHLQTDSILEGYISEAIIEKKKCFETVISLKKVYQNHSKTITNGKIKCLFPKQLSHSLQIGDVILFKAQLNEINPPAFPEQFNYKKYLEAKGIFHSTYLTKNQFIKISHINTPYILAQKARVNLIKLFRKSYLNKDGLAIVSALFLGEKKLLNTTIKDHFTTIGAMHVLAVSGLHVGILLFIINGCLNFFFRKNKSTKLKLLLSILLIWGFAFITGLSVSVMRASIMFSLIAIGRLLLENKNIYNIILASAFVLLIINPNFITDIGFQLSYLAVLGIIYFYPKIFNLFFIKNKIINYIWSITAVSIAAQIATIPISIFYFHQISILSILSNIFVTCFAILIITIGVLMLSTIYIDFIFLFLSKCLNTLIEVLLQIVKKLALTPYGKLEGLTLSTLELGLYFVGVFCFIILLETKRLKYLNYTLMILLCFTISKHYNYNQRKQLQKITFLNTNNQIAFNITTPNNNILCHSISDKEVMYYLSKSLQNFWLKNTSKKATTKILSKNNELVILNKLKILILNHQLNTSIEEWCDFVIINNPKLNLEKINQLVRTNTIVFSNKISPQHFLYFKNKIQFLEVNLYTSLNNPCFKINL
ncbi:MAG: ComEC family competence protein [Flavobacteriales bacterium]|jgi:competence protein ComEC|nr:ComEC family competence protein [Flavobacteriales bacterium]